MTGDNMKLYIKVGELEIRCEGRYGDVKAEREAFTELLPVLNEMKLGSRIVFARPEAIR